MRTLLVSFNAQYVHTCLALYSLRTNAGYDDIVIREFTVNQPLMECLGDTLAVEPDLVLISVYIWNRSRALSYAAEVRRILPGTSVYLGGPEAAADAPGILAENPGITGVFTGEAETSLAAFLPRFEREGVQAIADGLVLREDFRPPAPPVALSQLTFPYTDEELRLLGSRILYYESSRGCPHSCTYCLSCVSGSLRQKPFGMVTEDLRRFIAAKVRLVKFVDRSFNVDPERTAGILEAILQAPDCHTSFHFEVSAEHLDSKARALLARMPAGRVQLEAGLQSATPRVLAAVRRTSDPARVADALRALRPRENVHIHLDLIAGLPRETYASFLSSFDTAWRMEPDHLQVGFLKVLRGTPLYRDRAEYGLVHQEDPPYEILATRDMTARELFRIRTLERVAGIYGGRETMPVTLQAAIGRFSGGPARFFLALADHLGESGTRDVPDREDRFLRMARFLEREMEGLLPWRGLLLFDFLRLCGNRRPGRSLCDPDQLRFLDRWSKNHELLEAFRRTLGVDRSARLSKTVRPMVFSREVLALCPGGLSDGLDNGKGPVVLLFDHSVVQGIYGRPRIHVLAGLSPLVFGPPG